MLAKFGQPVSWEVGERLEWDGGGGKEVGPMGPGRGCQDLAVRPNANLCSQPVWPCSKQPHGVAGAYYEIRVKMSPCPKVSSSISQTCIGCSAGRLAMAHECAVNGRSIGVLQEMGRCHLLVGPLGYVTHPPYKQLGLSCQLSEKLMVCLNNFSALSVYCESWKSLF